MKVKDIMTSNPACCNEDQSLVEVARMMLEHDCGAIPVVATDGKVKVKGIITDRDIVTRAIAKNRNPLEMTAKDCMTSSPVTVSTETDLEECCDKLEQNQVRRVPVVDRNGACCGIIAQADIALNSSEHETAHLVKDISQPSGIRI